MNNLVHRDRGIILPAVIGLSVVMMILAVVILRSNITSFKIADDKAEEVRVHEIATGEFRRYYDRIARYGPEDIDDVYDMGDYSVNAKAEKSTGKLIITVSRKDGSQ